MTREEVINILNKSVEEPTVSNIATIVAFYLDIKQIDNSKISLFIKTILGNTGLLLGCYRYAVDYITKKYDICFVVCAETNNKYNGFAYYY